MPDLSGFVNSDEVGGKIKYGLNGLKMRQRETTLIDGLELNLIIYISYIIFDYVSNIPHNSDFFLWGGIDSRI